MNLSMTSIPALVCAIALACGPASAFAISGAEEAASTARLSSDQSARLKELLAAHGVPSAHQLAGEITREITASKGAPATAARYRPWVLPPREAAPARTAIVKAREPGAAKPARARAPTETPSPRAYPSAFGSTQGTEA